MNSSFRVITMTAALIMTGAAAHAQQGPAPVMAAAQYEDDMGFDNPPDRRAPPSEAKREEVRKKVEAVRMWRLTEELKLDEKTGTQLASFLSSIEEKRRGLMKTQNAAMKALRSSLGAEKPDERKLKAELDKIEKNQNDLVELRQKEINGIKGMLTTEQQARYIIFQQEFRREVRGMIAGARGAGPGNGPIRGPEGTRGPGGPGDQRPGGYRQPPP